MSESRAEIIEKIKILEELERRENGRKLFTYYPDEGPLRRDLYKKHTQFFEAGNRFPERLMLAANRVGKTEGVGAYEATLHLTGLYPPWWKGRRFNRPTEGWAAGDTSETVRDIIQVKLLGKIDEAGIGMIPRSNLHDFTRRSGRAECVDTIYVKHVSGGVSTLGLKSYDQKRKSFQGTKKDFIWLDEEPGQDIYTECLLRTMDTSGSDDNGLMLLTFTPLLGMSEMVLAFLPNGEIKDGNIGAKYVVMASWDDAPHLSQKAKDLLWSSIPPFQRDARSKGIPQLGAGAIYPVPESDILVTDFEIPDFWPRGYGMDVGWNRTSAGFHVLDRENDIIYRHSEHYRGQAEPSIHAESIKARGDWLTGVVDPAARGRSQKDGQKLIDNYTDLGLNLQPAFNGVEAGLLEMWQRLSTGRYKVFRSCQNWIAEYRLYRRDEKGQVVKGFDHAMDDSRYFVMSGIEFVRTKPVKKENDFTPYSGGTSSGWMRG